MPLIVLLAVGHAGFAGARLAVSLNALYLQASALTVGVLMSLMMVVATFISVPVGRWVDRIGYRKPSLIGLAGVVVGAWCPALLPSLAGLALASVLVGTGFTVVHVAVNNAIGHAAGIHRTRAFGLMGVGFSLSALSGPMVAGLAIDHFGYRAAFGILSVFPLLATALLLWAAPELRPEPRERTASGGVTDLLRLPPLRSVLVVSALISSGWDLFTFLVPLHGARNGLSATAIGLVAGGFGVGSAVVRLALPWIAARVPEWKLLGSALVLAALCYFLMPFCNTVASMLPLALALGMVLGSGQPVVMSLLHDTAPPGRTGEAVGLRSAIISMNQMVLPLACGAFGSALGLLPLFWAVATLLGAGGGYAVTRRR
ncbi:MAG: major facilitator superfamily 1 [Ramlibacter sp.]|nr:major facilitator superfamily 1 [Ramlibacter sp.]